MVRFFRNAIGIFPAGLIRFLYTLLYLPLSPLILLYLLRRPDSRKRLREYFGFINREAACTLANAHNVIWIHGVSVGEVLSVIPVVKRLKKALPNYHFLLSSTIEDAFRLVEDHPNLFDAKIFLPLDFPPFLDLVINAVKPKAVLISETDFWPNFLFSLKTRKIPLYLVNGRISGAFHDSFRSMSPFASAVLNSFTHFFVQTRQDYDRLLCASVSPENVTVAGNTKYDGCITGATPEPINTIINKLQSLQRRIVVAGSTHSGEEELIFSILHNQQKENNEKLIAIIAPRIIGRSTDVIRQAKDNSFRYQLWSEILAGQPISSSIEILVIDTLGIIKWLYALGDLVFIGGSFSKGGHNFLEAVLYKKAVLCGPDMRNFHSDVAMMKANDGIVQAQNQEDLLKKAHTLLKNPSNAEGIGERAYLLLMKQQGASEFIAETILSMSFPEMSSRT